MPKPNADEMIRVYPETHRAIREIADQRGQTAPHIAKTAVDYWIAKGAPMPAATVPSDGETGRSPGASCGGNGAASKGETVATTRRSSTTGRADSVRSTQSNRRRGSGRSRARS